MCFALLFTSWMTADPLLSVPPFSGLSHMGIKSLLYLSLLQGLFDMFQGWLILEGYLDYANLGNLSKGSLAFLTPDTWWT
ncbi:hypothetical protein GDO81_006174 [Engystomops pustulosus]|uniref:Uncharacterized protein n=1 Tax=Engystomops pustulosus TaxID=76066 RepID=A0AAV7CV03_ENGPU|nr:hypothetical protein GDO81_006174 [Engystomops pustulosus]